MSVVFVLSCRDPMTFVLFFPGERSLIDRTPNIPTVIILSKLYGFTNPEVSLLETAPSRRDSARDYSKHDCLVYKWLRVPWSLHRAVSDEDPGEEIDSDSVM
jgi:hypothetical protein